MTARCKNCNQYKDFRNKRGNKLSDSTCKCGGKFELLSGTWTGENMIYLNRANEKFLIDPKTIESIHTMKFVRI